MQRIRKGRWLLAGLIVLVVTAPFIGCAGEKSVDSGSEPLGQVSQATTPDPGFKSAAITENLYAAGLPLGQFGELDTHVHRSADGLSATPADWQLMLKTKGLTDLHVQSNIWAPGSHTGWHTHPGPSLISITAGTLTVYDESCRPRVFSARGADAAATPGSGFVDVGGGDVHLVRNEGSVEARAVAVQFIPAGAPRRIDVPIAPCTLPDF
jgi:hypothetical protein